MADLLTPSREGLVAIVKPVGASLVPGIARLGDVADLAQGGGATGATGPAGPNGDTGPAGATGPQGPAGGLLKHERVELTSEQLLALFSSPVEIVATPGAGKYLRVVSSSYILNFGSSAYAGDTTAGLYYGSGSGQSADSPADTVFQNGSSDIKTGAPASIDVNDPAAVENQSLVLTSQTSDMTDGDGTGVVEVWYVVAGEDDTGADEITVGLVPHAGGGQADATQLSYGYNVLSPPAGGLDSVQLPAALAGSIVQAFVAGAWIPDNLMTVYAKFGTADTINGFSNTADMLFVPARHSNDADSTGQVMLFVCKTDGEWWGNVKDD